jgi:hypothetical protein
MKLESRVACRLYLAQPFSERGTIDLGRDNDGTCDNLIDCWLAGTAAAGQYLIPDIRWIDQYQFQRARCIAVH